MKAHIQILIIISAILLGSCKHEIIPAPISNSPIYGIEGTFSEASFSIVAGMENAVMTPSVIETDGIKIYKSILGNDQSYFQLEIFNGNIDFPNQPKFDPNSINEISFAPYNQGTLWRIQKSDFPNSSVINQIKWYVDGVEQVTLDELEIYRPGKYDICAKVTFENQSESTLCRKITVGFAKNADFNMMSEVTSGNNLTGSVLSTIGNIASVKWFLDENLISSNVQFTTVLPNAKYMLRAEVTFDNGIIVNRATVADVSWNGNDVADFSSLAAQTNEIWDYKAKISFFKDGKMYRSSNEFNQDRKIVVDEIVGNGTDSNGVPIYILKGNADIVLSDTNFASFPLKAKMAIGLLVK